MASSCSADLIDVFSPASRVAGQIPIQGHLRPPISVDDRFFYRCALHRLRRAACRGLARRRLCGRVLLFIEFLLLASVLLLVVALVVLHSLVVPAPGQAQLTASAWSLARPLTSALRAPGRAVELLRVDLFGAVSGAGVPECPEPAEAPGLCHRGAVESQQAWAIGGGSHCEFAAEQTLLELSAAARGRAYAADATGNTALSVAAVAELGELPRAVLRLPGISAAVARRRILAALVWGPLHEEVAIREAALNATLGYAAFKSRNSTEPASLAPNNSLADVDSENRGVGMAYPGHWHSDAWSGPLPDWGHFVGKEGIAGKFGNNSGGGSAALQLFSCDGQPSVSMRPLRRMAELIHRRAEWWLFKVVWLLSAGVLTLLVGVAMSFSLRAAAFAIFRLCRDVRQLMTIGTCRRMELLEAIVSAISPAVLAKVFHSVAGDSADDVAVLLVCQVGAEVAALCTLRTEESWYIFPRVLLLLYVTDVYYILFHPLGFAGLAHSALAIFQCFLLCVLWNHYEATARTTAACPDQLSVAVRLWPRETPREFPMTSIAIQPPVNGGATFAPQVQRLLLEQGQLLLGDDRSYESAVVMSAVVARALQGAGVPTFLRPQAPAHSCAPGARGRTAAAGLLAALHSELLGGGPAEKVLVEHARAGDRRCMQLLEHLTSRLLPEGCALQRVTIPLFAAAGAPPEGDAGAPQPPRFEPMIFLPSDLHGRAGVIAEGDEEDEDYTSSDDYSPSESGFGSSPRAAHASTATIGVQAGPPGGDVEPMDELLNQETPSDGGVVVFAATQSSSSSAAEQRGTMRRSLSDPGIAQMQL